MKPYQHRTRQMYIDANGRLTNAEREAMERMTSLWPFIALLTILFAVAGLKQERNQQTTDHVQRINTSNH